MSHLSLAVIFTVFIFIFTMVAPTITFGYAAIACFAMFALLVYIAHLE